MTDPPLYPGMTAAFMPLLMNGKAQPERRSGSQKTSLYEFGDSREGIVERPIETKRESGQVELSGFLRLEDL